MTSIDVKKSPHTEINFFWFRRDLRIYDNHAFSQALESPGLVQAVFILDKNILRDLDSTDFRIAFLRKQLMRIKSDLKTFGTDLWIFSGDPLQIWSDLIQKYSPKGVYCNRDYEPYAIERDQSISDLCEKNLAEFKTYKDQVIFEKKEVLSNEKKAYSIFTPYKKKWLSQLDKKSLKSFPTRKNFSNLNQTIQPPRTEGLPDLETLGFKNYPEEFYPTPNLEEGMLKSYSKNRDFPFLDGATSRLGVHLRFGTVSVRELVNKALKLKAETWLSELIWREFFMQILWHYPNVVTSSFRPQYDKIKWRNDEQEFEKWKQGLTGFPLVDAGMRELNQTGHMHNRVRMLVASFLTKHLLIDWRKGERYFASKLLDYDLSSNNGNWQWAAGTGCDAAPYFRVFNPQSQLEKFDPEFKYVKKWVPEWGTPQYPEPMVDHKMARNRALKEFERALKFAQDSEG